jgi:TatD DNase family protein
VIDTHAHLGADAVEVIERAHAAGVTRIVTVATTLEGGRQALELAEAHGGVYVALGIHPHEAATFDLLRLGELQALLDHPRVVAVGETGLDYFRDYAPPDAQQELFAAQLKLAGEAGKPVVIHTRAADDDTRAQLEAHEGIVILHCFSSEPLLEPALAHGWYVSFAGNVTYKNAYDLRAAARRVPADRLLVETDSPYLAPQAVRGRRNEPAYIVHTYAGLANVRGTSVADLVAQVDANADAVFGL